MDGDQQDDSAKKKSREMLRFTPARPNAGGYDTHCRCRKKNDVTTLPLLTLPVPATLLEARCREEWTLFRLPDPKRLSVAPAEILDIGSGWGGLGLDLAQNSKVSVVGINLSDEQVRIAQQRAAAEGLSCEFRIQDYRKVAEKFDRIVSVGMFEHVGKRYYDAFFRKCYDLLVDDGIMLLLTIGCWNGPSDTNAWVWRYIFPGGYTPALSELAPAIERSGRA